VAVIVYTGLQLVTNDRL